MGLANGFRLCQSARSAGSVASICYAIIIVVVIVDAVDDLTNMLISTRRCVSIQYLLHNRYMSCTLLLSLTDTLLSQQHRVCKTSMPNIDMSCKQWRPLKANLLS